MRILSLVLLSAGCYSEWKAEDVDGDGISILEGDCWESSFDPVPPEGAMDHGVTADKIYVGAEDLPYDGIDANCDGKDDFDVDGDGFVPAQYEGFATLGVVDSGNLPGGDCFDSIELSVFDDPTGELTPADVNPDITEVYYDGADQNCDGLSDYDQDQDGVDFEAYGGLDCNDEDAEIYPLATEVYYDGVDQNCDGENDFDQDGDGQESAEYDGADCDDTNADIYASTEELPHNEIYYNGIDDNCDLSDGDGDKDGDGFWAVDYPFLEGEVDSSVEYPEVLDDCWDDEGNPPAEFETFPLNGFHGLTATQVNPGETERFYDGIDQNCDGGNDFDQDGDGFNSDAYQDRDGRIGEDCVDSENEDDFFAGGPTPAEINPDNPTEVWYDGNDQNCDSLNDFDQDQDGQNSSDHGGPDCNDLDEDIFNDPNLSSIIELPNDGIDQNCDGLEDCYVDADGDSFGSGTINTSTELSCVTAGFANNSTDCDDSDETIYPNAIELCDGLVNECGGALPADEIDNDSDGYVECTFDFDGWDGDSGVIGGGDCDDQDANTIPDLIWYADLDIDGFGDANNSTTACLQPPGFIADNTDCNDGDNTVYLGAPEICDGQDNSCSGSLLPVESDLDGDLYIDCTFDINGWDGDPAILGDEDCDDNDSSIHPNATEGLNDGVDQNCDGLELCPVDSDGDTYGDSSSGTGLSPNCNMGGFSADDTDCDDNNNRAFPGAAVNDSSTSCLLDADFDGYGDISPSNPNISSGTDCDDSDGSIYPNAAEGLNDGVDQNCDNQELCYLDADQDGYGNSSGNSGLSSSLSCVAVGFSGTADDCNDSDETVYPNASELCDGQMNDCNGLGIPSTETDDDGDLYVDCTIDGGGWDGLYVEGGGDCDDTDERVYPFGIEQCDGIANICGTTLDAAETDTDGDLYVECDNWTGSSQILGGSDCAPSNSAIHPNAAETVNDGIDQNCDNQELCYVDNDEDGYGNPGGNTGLSSTLSCVTAGFANNSDDCDDIDEIVYPGAPEICDGIFNDCSDSKIGTQDAPNDELDIDGDFYVECDIGNNVWKGDTSILDGGDCDINNASINPWAFEHHSSADSNCDGLESEPDISYCEGNVYTDVGDTYDKYFATCYKTSGDEPTWQEAETLCLNHGYDGLASISDVDEKNFVKGLLDYDVWIGLNDIVSEGNYVWTNGDTSTYTHWNSGEPDGSTGENCIRMNTGAGKWDDMACTSLIDFVCSKTRLR